MVATDFEFDGIKASEEYGLIICNINGGSEDTILAGAPLVLHTVPVRNGSYHYMASTSYNSVLETTFQVIKFSCLKGDFEPLTIDEKRKIMRWLNRKEYCVTKFYHDEKYKRIETITKEEEKYVEETNLETGETITIPVIEEIFEDILVEDTRSTYDGVYYEGTFDSISEIYISGICVGLELHYVTNRPYGYRDYNFETTILNEDTMEEEVVYAVDPLIINTIELSEGQLFTFEDYSDEVGYIYPKEFKIICHGSGDLKITNEIESVLNNKTGEFEGRDTIIRNCSNEEIITFTDELTFTTSIPSHKIQNDFNYIFFRIANKYNDKINRIKANMDCSIEIKYDPIIKGVGI